MPSGHGFFKIEMNWNLYYRLTAVIANTDLEGCFNAFRFQKNQFGKMYSIPTRIDERFENKKLYLEIPFAVRAEPTVSPLNAYVLYQISIKGEDENISVIDIDTGAIKQIVTGDFTNRRLKVLEIELPENLFVGKTGKYFAVRLARDGANVNDTYNGDIDIFGASIHN